MSDAPIVWFAGTDWSGVQGTDHRMVAELARRAPVLWVDPARRGAWRGWSRAAPVVASNGAALERVGVPATPGITRVPFRAVTRILRELTFHRVRAGRSIRAVVVANPIVRFPRTEAPKVLFMTDDWVAGAELMGFSRPWLARILRSNVAEADAIAGVSPALLDLVAADTRASTQGMVIANGAPSGSPWVRRGEREPVAGLVGQINERIDLSLVSAIAYSGIAVRVIGPLTARDPRFIVDFTRLTRHPLVEWVGAVRATEVPEHLSRIGVGLTPYTLSRFNRASSPLKTLEYLAAGVAVVASDLPASRWLDSPEIAIAKSGSDFVAATAAAISRRAHASGEDRRMAFARAHGWDRRANDMQRLIHEARRSDAASVLEAIV